MNSVEIEDVLSSIRRLVSEDLRPMPRSTPEPGVGAKLILTPAFRVITSEAAPVAVPDVTQGNAAADSAPGPMIHAEPGNVAAVAESIPEPAYEADQSNLAQAIRGPSSIEAVVAVVGAGVVEEDWEAEVDILQTEDTSWEADECWRLPEAFDPVLDRITEVEDADVVVTLRSDPSEAWHKEDDGWGDDVAEPVAVDADTDSAGALMPEAADTNAAALADQAEAEAVAEILSLQDDVADDTGADRLGHGRRLSGITMFDDAESGIDEEMLRDLVRDIIREELQGSLGERITRNVRKLVRVEINRALSTRDLE